MHIPTSWAGRHDCEQHYALVAVDMPRSKYSCSVCGSTIWLNDEQWDGIRKRAAMKRAAIDAIPVDAPSPVRTDHEGTI